MSIIPLNEEDFWHINRLVRDYICYVFQTEVHLGDEDPEVWTATGCLSW